MNFTRLLCCEAELGVGSGLFLRRVSGAEPLGGLNRTKGAANSLFSGNPAL